MEAIKNLALRVANEPALIVAAIVAVANQATDQTWQGYGAAALTVVLRFLVTGPLSPYLNGPKSTNSQEQPPLA